MKMKLYSFQLVSIITSILYASFVTAGAKLDCTEFNIKAQEFGIFLNEHVGRFVKPSSRDDLKVEITEENIKMLEDFAGYARKVAFTKYSTTPCEVLGRCDVLSLDPKIRTLITNLNSMAECARSKCTVSELSAIMQFLVPAYDRLQKTLGECTEKSKKE